jgi:hypothetical protein
MNCNNLVTIYLEYLNYSESYVIIESFDVHSISKAIGKKLDIVEKELKKLKVNISSLKDFGKDLFKILMKYYDQGKSPKDTADLLKDEISSKLKAIVEKSDIDLTIGGKVSRSLISFLMIVVINTVLMGLFIPFGPTVALILTGVTIAPLVEESLKTYFIKMNMPYFGTSIVFGLELIMYVVQLTLGGMIVPMSILLRIPSYLMHFFTTFIQKHIRESGTILQDRNKIAWFAAVLIHCFFNSIMIVGGLMIS